MIDQTEESPQSFEDSLPNILMKRRTNNVDKEKTIGLIKKAKGARTQKAFANAMTIDESVVSRILSGKTTELSPALISKIASYADPGSGVTLEQLMEAQGFGGTGNSRHAAKEFADECQRIIAFELLHRGAFIEKSADDGTGSFDFTFFTNALSDSFEPPTEWAFEVLYSGCGHIFFYQLRDRLNLIMAEYYKGYPAGRATLVTDNEAAYKRAKEILAPLTIPDEISVMLISTSEKRILNEYIAPLSNGRQGRSVFELPDSERKEDT